MTGTKKEEVIYNDGMDITPEQNTPKTLTAEEQKIDQIKRIVQADRQAYEEWLKDPTHQRKLDMDHAALRYLMIPERVLELADNPAAVDLLVLKQSPGEAKVYVLEHKTEPITDRKKLEEYWAYSDAEMARQEAEALTAGEQVFAIAPEPSADVDFYHAYSPELVRDGKLALNDFITNSISIARRGDEILTVGQYFERDATRGLGVATSFYTRFHNSAKELGFRFIIGSDNDRNVGFFTEKLGRVPLSRIKPEFKTIFHPQPEVITQETFTVDFLRPEDKAAYVDQPTTG